MKESQNKQILDHLLKGNAISNMLAFRLFKCTSLHRRLADLRNGRHDGKKWPISYGDWVNHGGSRFKVYKMMNNV